jgi:hypothetical protein
MKSAHPPLSVNAHFYLQKNQQIRAKISMSCRKCVYVPPQNKKGGAKMPPRDREPNYYNKGQEDKAKDKFDPPRSPATAPFWSKEDEKDWKDYEAGRKNTENQQKD